MLSLSGAVTFLYSLNPWILSIGALLVISLLVLITSVCIHWFYRRPTSVILPTMPKRDFTLRELSQFDGTGMDGRILIAVNGNVFDVTHDGKGFYGKDGPYAIFAGRDASRSLTMFTTDMPTLSEEFDDLSDLTSDQMNNLREWELQFRERYPLVGKLLSPSETHHLYEGDDDEPYNNVSQVPARTARPKTD